jgi:hypothetical protein
MRSRSYKCLRVEPTRTLLILVLFLLGCIVCRATQIIAIQTRTTIIVGADSKLIGGQPETTTKIIKAGDLSFASSGMYDDPFRKIVFSDIVRDALDDPKSPIDSRISQMDSLLEEQLTVTFKQMRDNSPGQYDRYRNGRRAFLSVLVFQIDKKGRSHVYERNFRADAETSSVKLDKSTSYACPGNCDVLPCRVGPNLPKLTPTGHGDEWVFFIGVKPGNCRWIEYPVDQMIQFVCSEIKQVADGDPLEVGPPLTFLLLTVRASGQFKIAEALSEIVICRNRSYFKWQITEIDADTRRA